LTRKLASAAKLAQGAFAWCVHKSSGVLLSIPGLPYAQDKLQPVFRFI
jgi:hypothetical protein